MTLTLLKAILVGIGAAAPIGPIALLVMQKTLCNGRTTGFFTGAGSSLGDLFFAGISLVAVSLVRDFIDSKEALIFAIGGVCVALVGLNLAMKRPSLEGRHQNKKIYATGLGQAFVCTLANPGALAFMLAMVAMADFDSGVDVPKWILLLFIWLGSLTWWGSFTLLVSLFRGKVGEKSLRIVSVISGLVIIGLGIYLTIKGIIAL